MQFLFHVTDRNLMTHRLHKLALLAQYGYCEPSDLAGFLKYVWRMQKRESDAQVSLAQELTWAGESLSMRKGVERAFNCASLLVFDAAEPEKIFQVLFVEEVQKQFSASSLGKYLYYHVSSRRRCSLREHHKACTEPAFLYEELLRSRAVSPNTRYAQLLRRKREVFQEGRAALLLFLA